MKPATDVATCPTARVDDPSAIQAIAQAVASWEPSLELYTALAQARPFEPDGTLYAIALSEATLRIHHRDRHVQVGDLIVLPRDLAIDAEPEVDLLCLRHDGDGPDHFRERFLQVWGFEHFASGVRDHIIGRSEVLPASDLRFRLPYSVVTVEVDPIRLETSALEAHLLIGLEGTTMVQSSTNASARPLGPREVAWVGPGSVYEIAGTGRVGLVVIEPELARETRVREARERVGEPPSPEYRPPLLSGNDER
jgi:hypothetical protein